MLRKRKTLKYWVISKQYMRKMSEERVTEKENIRKVSWSEEMEVLAFDNRNAPSDIEKSSILVEIIN